MSVLGEGPGGGYEPIPPEGGIGSGRNYDRAIDLTESLTGTREGASTSAALKTFVGALQTNVGGEEKFEEGYPELSNVLNNGKSTEPRTVIEELKKALGTRGLVNKEMSKKLLVGLSFRVPIRSTWFSGGYGPERIVNILKRADTFLLQGSKFQAIQKKIEEINPAPNARASDGDLGGAPDVRGVSEKIIGAAAQPILTRGATPAGTISQDTTIQKMKSEEQTGLGDMPRVMDEPSPPDIELTLKFGGKKYTVKDQGKSANGQIKGRGRFGRVFLGYDELGNAVAIKVSRVPEGSHHLLKELKDEAIIQMGIGDCNSPHLLGASAAGELDGTMFTVMPPKKGGDLYGLAIAGKTSPKKVMRIMRDTAEALEAMHAKGYVHRDLRPENVMLDDGNPQRGFLMDYGFANKIAPGKKNLDEEPVCGTPGYVDPHFVKTRISGPKTDVYSYGALLYTVLAGKYANPNPNEWSPNITHEDWSDLETRLTWRSVKPSNIEEIVNILKACMKEAPEYRPDMETVRKRMDNLLAAM